MNPPASSIQPVKISDVFTITRMAHLNMQGVDQLFTELVSNPLLRWTSYLFLPFYFLVSGRGYKFVMSDRIAGCAYLHLHRSSGFIFNVNVNPDFRRKGVAQGLISHLENLTLSGGRFWTTLQVDSINDPARSLYKKLGYEAHNPVVFRWEEPSPLISSNTSSVRIKPLSSIQGSSLFRRYQALELKSDGKFSLKIIDEIESERGAAQAYWECTYHDKAIGCASTSGTRKQPFVQIVLDYEFWGDPLLEDLIGALLQAEGERPTRIDVAFGSRGHSQEAESILTSMNFAKRSKPRLLMYKALENRISDLNIG